MVCWVRFREVYTSELFAVIGDVAAGSAPPVSPSVPFGVEHGLARLAKVNK
jgi:hypothetical protein